MGAVENRSKISFFPCKGSGKTERGRSQHCSETPAKGQGKAQWKGTVEKAQWKDSGRSSKGAVKKAVDAQAKTVEKALEAQAKAVKDLFWKRQWKVKQSSDRSSKGGGRSSKGGGRSSKGRSSKGSDRSRFSPESPLRPRAWRCPWERRAFGHTGSVKMLARPLLSYENTCKRKRGVQQQDREGGQGGTQEAERAVGRRGGTGAPLVKVARVGRASCGGRQVLENSSASRKGLRERQAFSWALRTVPFLLTESGNVKLSRLAAGETVSLLALPLHLY